LVAVIRENDLQSKGLMKRIGNLYADIISIENLQLADAIARKGKSKQSGVKEHDKNRDANIIALHQALKDKTYQTGTYQHRTIYEPKVREISILPYVDRIVHHAIMNYLEAPFNAYFTAFTYSSIKGKGIHGAADDVKYALRDVQATEYFLKLDIRKFYPSVNHSILKQIIRRKIKDKDLLWLLDSIIDSAPGLPIGNYLSAYFANLYLTPFDHWLKEQLGVANCFRYADDIVVLADCKEYLHGLLAFIICYLHDNLKLEVKHNSRVCPVKTGLDFVGYVFYDTHILLRPSIKRRFARMMARNPLPVKIAAYNGWAKYANCRNLIKKLQSTNEQIQRFQHTNQQKQLQRG